MRQRSSQNEWSAWSSWSTCSLTCGQGTRMRRRDCVGQVADKLVRLEAPSCRGRGVEHFLCRLAECAPGDKDPRAYQCSLRNDQPVQGKTYEWAPYSGGTNQCELTCMAVGFNFYYNFGKLFDGTPCRTATTKGDSGATVVCVNGNCATAGCDGRVGSNAVYDKCHMCGGRNVTCLHYKAAYLLATPETGYGYTKIATIPKGACDVTFRDNSTNYLSLQEDSGRYIVNGDWKISHTGNYSAGGVQFMYRRQGAQETLRAAGPLTENVSLVLMFRQQNPGVYFEYYIARNQTINDTSAANFTITPMRRHYRHRYSGAPRRTPQKPRLNRGQDEQRNTRRNGRRGPAIPPYPGSGAPRGSSRGGLAAPSRVGEQIPPGGSFQPRHDRPQESSSNDRNTPNTHPPTERGTGKRENHPSTYVEGSSRDASSYGSRNTGTGSRGGSYTNRHAPGGNQRNDVSPIPPRLPDRSGRLPNDPRTKGVRVYVVGEDHPASREHLPQPGLPRPGVYPRRKRLYGGNGRAYPTNPERGDAGRGGVSSPEATRADMSINQAYWSRANTGGIDPKRGVGRTPIRTVYPKRDSLGNTGRGGNIETGVRRTVNSYGYGGKPTQAGGGYDRSAYKWDSVTNPAANMTPVVVRPWLPRPPQRSNPATWRPTILPPFALPPYLGRPHSYPQHPRPRQQQISTPRTYPKTPLTPRPYPTQQLYPTRPPVSWPYPQQQYPTRSPVSRSYPQQQYPTRSPVSRSYPQRPAPTSTERHRPASLQPTAPRSDKQSGRGAKGGASGGRRRNYGKAWRKNKKSRTNAIWKNRSTPSRPETVIGGREREREREREGGREGGRERGKEGRTEGGRERRKEQWREGRRKGGKDGGRKGREGRKEEWREGRRKGGKDGGREGRTEVGREGRREGRTEEGREGRREGRTEEGREGRRKGGREGWRKGGKDRGREGRTEEWKEGRRKGWKDGGREGRMEEGREGRRKGGKDGGMEGKTEEGREGRKGGKGGRRERERGKEGRMEGERIERDGRTEEGREGWREGERREREGRKDGGKDGGRERGERERDGRKEGGR
ncbi:ADAMTS-like protein 5 [Lamellibrachia satsuma]|nr:ADAMTS-like protein 5 [Lamellibrachia satsuma]